jgi:hypothetical protein
VDCVGRRAAAEGAPHRAATQRAVRTPPARRRRHHHHPSSPPPQLLPPTRQQQGWPSRRRVQQLLHRRHHRPELLQSGWVCASSCCTPAAPTDARGRGGQRAGGSRMGCSPVASVHRRGPSRAGRRVRASSTRLCRRRASCLLWPRLGRARAAAAAHVHRRALRCSRGCPLSRRGCTGRPGAALRRLQLLPRGWAAGAARRSSCGARWCGVCAHSARRGAGGLGQAFRAMRPCFRGRSACAAARALGDDSHAQCTAPARAAGRGGGGGGAPVPARRSQPDRCTSAPTAPAAASLRPCNSYCPAAARHQQQQ